MTTPAAHIPAAPTYRRILPYIAVPLAVAAAVALFLSVLSGSDGAVSSEIDNSRDWTRAETIDHLSRVNGVGAGATSGAATQEMTRAEALERLYHINGVAPEEPTVPGGLRAR